MRSVGPQTSSPVRHRRPGGARTAWLQRAGCGLLVALGLSACSTSDPAGSAPVARAPSAPAPPLSSGPARSRATVVLLHGGGWAGPDVQQQKALDSFPGAQLRAQGFETVSLDYAAGKRGVASVRRQLAGLRRDRPERRICLYGESAGGNLALLAAADRRVACVMTLGAPTDFAAWRRAAAARASGLLVDSAIPRDRRPISLAIYRQTARAIFGEPGVSTRRYEPAFQARRIRARVLLAQQADDVVVPRSQISSFRRRSRRGVRTLTLPAGTAKEAYLHGTLSREGRTRLVDALVRLVRSGG